MTYLLGSPKKNVDIEIKSDYVLPVHIFAQHKNDNSKNCLVQYNLNWLDLSHAKIGYKINPDGKTEPYIFKQDDKSYNISLQEITIEQPFEKYEILTLQEISTKYQLFTKIIKYEMPEIENENFCVLKLQNSKKLIISAHEIINFFYTKSKYNLLKTAILTTEGLNRVVEDGKLTKNEDNKWLMTLTHNSKLVDKNQILYFLLSSELTAAFNAVGTTFIETHKLSAPIPVLSDMTILARVFERDNCILVLNILKSTHLKDCFTKVNSDDYLATHHDKLKREYSEKKSDKKLDKNNVTPQDALETNTSTSNTNIDDEIILEDNDIYDISQFDEKYQLDFTIHEIYYGTAKVQQGTIPNIKQVNGTLTTRARKGGKKFGKLLTNSTSNDGAPIEFNYSELVEKLKEDNYICEIHAGTFETLQIYFKTKMGKPSRRVELFKDYQLEHYRRYKLLELQKNGVSMLLLDIEARIIKIDNGYNYARNSILLIKSNLSATKFFKDYLYSALVKFVKTQQFVSSINDIMEIYPTKTMKHTLNVKVIKRNIDEFMAQSNG